MISKPKGKSKIDIKYIEDDKKRSDTLYKRRKGLVKKAYELSVICGVKISIICTDFEKTCFSYCNDARLSHDLEKVFKDVYKPIWISKFASKDYPFASVRGDTKEKIIFGKAVKKKFSAFGQSNKLQKEQLLGKREEPLRLSQSSALGRNFFPNSGPEDSPYHEPKKLKIEKSSRTNPESGGFSIPQYLSPNPRFIEFGHKINPSNIQDFLAVDLSLTIERIKNDPKSLSGYLKIDPLCLEKLESFRSETIKRMLFQEDLLDIIILRNFIRFYFSPVDTPPFNKIKKIPPNQIFSIISNLEEVKIEQVNEIFLLIILSKIIPRWNFNFLKKAKEVKFCAKSFSLKSVHIKNMMIARETANKNHPRFKKEMQTALKKGKKRSQGTHDVALGDIFSRYSIQFAVIQENWFTLTLNELIGSHFMQIFSNCFVDRLPKSDFKLLVSVTQNSDPKKIPFVKNLIKMGQSMHQSTAGSQRGGSLLNFGREIMSFQGSQSGDDNGSKLSDFSGGFSQFRFNDFSSFF